MRKLFILFGLLLPLISFGQDYSVFDDLGLSPSNYFLIPEDVQTGDYVGRFYSWFPKDTIDAIVFSIQTNINGLYKINPSTGIISIADASKMPEIIQQDTVHYLIIETTDGLETDLDTAYVRIKESAYSVFINMGAASGGNGTRTQPYKSWSSAKPFQGGYGYFQKRGTTHTGGVVDISLYASGTELNPTGFGAYGSGARPLFDGTNYQYNFVKGFSVGRTDGILRDSVKYVYFYEYKFYNWGGNGIYSFRYCTHIEINNCEFEENGHYEKGAGIYIHGNYSAHTPQYHKIRNCISHHNHEHGIKCEYTYNLQIINFWAYDNYYNTGHGIQMIGGTDNTVMGALLSNNRNMGIRCRNSNDTYEYLNINVAAAGEHGIQLDTVTDWSGQRHLGHYNTVRKFMITGANAPWLNGSGIYVINSTSGNVIEDGEIYENYLGLRFSGNSRNNRFSRVYFHDNQEAGLYLGNSTGHTGGHDSISFDYCIFDSNNKMITYNSSKARRLRFDNCTFYDNTMDVSPSDDVSIRNCITDAITGDYTGLTNYSLVEGGDPFVDSENGNFSLVEGSDNCGLGTNLGYQYDFRGYELGELISVGAIDCAATEPTSSVKMDVSKFSYFPVPVSEYLYLSGLGVKSLISVYDITGRECMHCCVNGSSVEKVDLRGLNAGLYYFMVQNEQNQMKSYKFIKN